MLVGTLGKQYSLPEFRDILGSAGFSDVQAVRTGGGYYSLYLYLEDVEGDCFSPHGSDGGVIEYDGRDIAQMPGAERSRLRGNRFPEPSVLRERRELAEQAHQLANHVGLRQVLGQDRGVEDGVLLAGVGVVVRADAVEVAIDVEGGPPVRPLDRFYTRLRDGQVEVGPRYSVNSEFRRFPSYRDPGQALDGIGQYLYPGRFSTPKLD